MSSINQNSKSPEEIEREVEEVRANVRSTLGDIRESLSPGQMLDQGLEYVRGSGGADFTRNLGRQMRDHPIPVALIGAGIGWLLLSERMGGGYVGRHGHTRYTADELYTDPDRHHVHVDGDEGYAERAGEMASEAGHRMGEAAHSMRERASSMASSVGETVSSVASGARRMMHDARDRVTGAASTASDYASSAASTASDYASSASEQMRYASGGVRHASARARDYGYRAQRSMSHMVEEQPMILGAVGFAIGAILGAALPSTRYENRMMGTAADRMKESARQMAREGVQQASAAAGEVMQEARETLDERGISKKGVAETLSAVSETVKETIDPKRREGNGPSANGGASSTSTTGTSQPPPPSHH